MILKKIINSIQAINGRISGMESAPPLEDYPTSIDTLEMPLALTQIVSGSSFNEDGSIVANLETSVYFLPIAQEYYGVIQNDVVDLMDNFRRKYMDKDTYINDNPFYKNVYCEIDSNGNKAGHAWISPESPWGFSGYTLIEYPLGTQKFYHGFTVTFTVKGDNDLCN